MKPETSLVKGRVVVALDLNELIASVPDEDRKDLMQYIACEESVIQAVVDQILTGCTDNGSFGYDDSTYDPAVDSAPYAINAARERIIKGADAVAREMIDRLRRAFRHARARSTADFRKHFDTERGLRDQLQLLRREHADAIEARDHWQAFANRINAERQAPAEGAAS